MADNRKTVAYDGLEASYQTMKIDNSEITYDATKAGGSASVGLAVALAGAGGASNDDIVDLAGDNENIFGKLISVQADGFCTVQVAGYMALPGGNGATLNLDMKVMGALNASSAKGYIKGIAETVTTPTAAEVTNAFRAAKSRGQIINNNDTAAVIVRFA